MVIVSVAMISALVDIVLLLASNMMWYIGSALALASNRMWYMGVALMGGLKYDVVVGGALALASNTLFHTTNLVVTKRLVRYNSYQQRDFDINQLPCTKYL